MHVAKPLKGILYRLYERQLLVGILQRPVPRHLGLIQDGHRRYARHVGLSNLEGYRLGANKATDVLTWCAELKIPMVSLWWLSTENLARESADVAAVLTVIEEKVAEWLHEGLAERLRIRIRPMGKLNLLPASTLQVLQSAEAATRDHAGILLNVGVGYGGRQEIIDAMAGYLSDHFSRGTSPEDILRDLTADMLDKYLYTHDCQPPFSTLAIIVVLWWQRRRWEIGPGVASWRSTGPGSIASWIAPRSRTILTICRRKTNPAAWV